MDKKQAYEEKVAAQLAEWDARIDLLKAKARKAEAGAKAEYQESIEDLQKKQSEAQEKLEELRSAGADAWEDLKSGIEESRKTLADAIENARSHFD